MLAARCVVDGDLIEAELNEGACCSGAMGKVARACWRDCSDDSRVTAAKGCFGEEEAADWVLSARHGSGLVVGRLWSRYCGS